MCAALGWWRGLPNTGIGSGRISLIWKIWELVRSADFSACQARLAARPASHVFVFFADFQPVVFAGFAWSNWNDGERNEVPRLHGDFMWQQFVNLKDIGIPSGYVAMFDEYDEGTAIAKGAEDASMIPTDQYFLTYDADGVHISSDFYLRMVGDAGKMLRGEIPFTREHPTPHHVN